MSNSWGSDSPISMPVPPNSKIEIKMFGFGMSRYGIAHDLTHEDYMKFRRPTFAPSAVPSNVIRDDAHLDEDF